MEKTYYFIEPPKEIGEIIERGSNLTSPSEHPVISAKEVRQRKIAHIAWTLIVTLIVGTAVWNNTEISVFTFVLLGVIAFMAYVVSFFIIYKDLQKVLHAINYFIGTKGAYYAAVKFNYDHPQEGIYLYDEIEDIQKNFVVKKVQEIHESSYHPRKIIATVKIKKAGEKSRTYTFEFTLSKHKNNGYEIADKSDPSYYFYRFLERLEKEWATRKKGALQKRSLTLYEVLRQTTFEPDPMVHMHNKDLMYAFLPALLIAVAIYVAVGKDFDATGMVLLIGGGIGWYVSSFFAKFGAMRIVQAVFFDLFVLGLLHGVAIMLHPLITHG